MNQQKPTEPVRTPAPTPKPVPTASERGLVGRYMQRDASQVLPSASKRTAEQVATRLDAMRADDKLQRSLSEPPKVDKDARTVDLSFSSMTEVKRWFGFEVLSHAPGAMRTERLESRAPLLWMHDWDDQRGVVIPGSIRLDGDKGRATVKFSRSPEGERLFQDVQDEITVNVSVGYRVHGAQLIEVRDDDTEVWLITDWEPYELSMVSVPADTDVGVGRSAEKPHEETQNAKPQNSPNTQNRQLPSDPKDPDTMNEKILRAANGDLVRAQVTDAGEIVKVLEVIEAAGEASRTAGNRASEAERTRTAAILDIGERYKMGDLARSFVKDGKSVEEFQRAALEESDKRMARPLAEQTRDANVGLTEDEVRKYSFVKLVRALDPKASAADREAAAFEFDCSRAAEKQYEKSARGAIVPADVLAGRAFNAGGAANTPAGAQTGAQLVGNTTLFGSFIDTLRNRTTAMRLATVMGGLVGTVDIPKKTQNGQAYWLGEGQDAQETGMAIGQIAFSPKTLAAFSEVTRRLLMQSTPDAEALMRSDLMDAIGQAIDVAYYYGTGSEYQPKGLLNYSGINGQVFANGMAPTFAELVGMETQIATDNADVSNMAYVANAKFRGHAKTAVKFASAGSATIWEQGGTVNGYRTEITNQIQDGQVFFGNFKDSIIALWGGLDVTVDPYSLSKSGGTRIVVFQDCDMNLRRLESFCLGKAA